MKELKISVVGRIWCMPNSRRFEVETAKDLLTGHIHALCDGYMALNGQIAECVIRVSHTPVQMYIELMEVRGQP